MNLQGNRFQTNVKSNFLIIQDLQLRNRLLFKVEGLEIFNGVWNSVLDACFCTEVGDGLDDLQGLSQFCDFIKFDYSGRPTAWNSE